MRDGFRPDLEGLRAVAVLLVVAYHADVPGIGGGFIGVDVFFVLSGFLITGLLLREVAQTGTVSLPAFYARRARRLIPASALVLAVTLVASAFLLPPLALPDVTKDVGAAAVYVSNIHFAVGATDYLRADVAPSPVLHFWSLSLEEQFYVFWPAIVLLAARMGGDARRRITIVAIAISVVSLLLAIWLTDANQPWAFFSLPARAWELGLGALLAVSSGRLARVPSPAGAAMAWAGIGMVAVSGVVISASTPFPGLAALLPTVGSALVIAGGMRAHRLAPGRWLGASVPRFIGRISYSLYLWHWPVLVLPAVVAGGHLSWPIRGGLVVAAVILATATKWTVEEPLRHGRWIGRRPRFNLALAGGVSAIIVAASFGVGFSTQMVLSGSAGGDPSADEAQLDEILGTDPPPASTNSPASTESPGESPASGGPSPSSAPWVRPSPDPGPIPAGLRPSLATVRDDNPQPHLDGCAGDRFTLRPDPCVYGDVNASTTVVLIGDSHALAWFPAIDRLAVNNGWRLLSMTKAACQPANVPMWDPSLGRVYDECATWRKAVLDRVEAIRPHLVVVTSSRTFSLANADGSGPAPVAQRGKAWRPGFIEVLETLRSTAGRVVVIADTPISTVDVPVCVSANMDDRLACATPVSEAIDPAWTTTMQAAADAAGVDFVDPAPWVCPTDPCTPNVGRYLVYRDRSHITATFSAALAGRLERALGSGATQSP